VIKDDLVQLYRARWNAELDLRSLKRMLQMDVLRCKTLELVRKEIRTHILAYNLVRTIMAQTADDWKPLSDGRVPQNKFFRAVRRGCNHVRVPLRPAD
jgi:hypothetical protein